MTDKNRGYGIGDGIGTHQDHDEEDGMAAPDCQTFKGFRSGADLDRTHPEPHSVSL